MKIKTRTAGLLFVTVIAMTTMNGCHLLKKSVSGGTSMSDDENVVRKVMNAQPDWKFVEVRLTGRAEEDKDRISFMGTVKMEKDKQIYVVLRSVLGFEVARVYADRDSVWINSKMLNIKEKGDWRLMAGKIGYPVDFYAMQGILVQSLFTANGDQLNVLLENLVVKNNKENLQLVSKPGTPGIDIGMKYTNEFMVDRESYRIDDTRIKDIKGQWITDIKYSYNKDNVIRKLELEGMDSERNFKVEINIIKKDIKDFIEINFDRF